jgi:hypothetical protein
MADSDRLTLRQAREQGRLREFVEQAACDDGDIPPDAGKKFDLVLRAAVKRDGADDQTSRSRDAGSLNSKRTRRGKPAVSRR